MNANQDRHPVNPLDLVARSGIAPSRQRGSALLIVIGTLALIAVFAAVYVAIGRTDRRAAQALTTQRNQKDTKIDVAKYLAGVIATDRLESYVQYDANGVAFARREVTDATYTDWTRRSEVTPGGEALLFTPSGGPFELGSLGPLNDFRVASDPWLAATLPTYLGNPGEPFASGTNLRPFSSFEPFDPLHPNSKNFLDNRDWLQISNLAPDGRPVNLYNLRPTVPEGSYGGINGADNAVGGFDSEPGFGTSPRTDGRPIRRMSNYLSLLDQETPADPESMIQAFDPAVEGVWIPGSNVPQSIGINGLALYNTPAVWTMYQRFMFMPIDQPFITKNRQGRISTWADPDFPPYQYADANGDGFADSRWFEMVSARDAGQGSGTGARNDVRWLYDKGDMRYFIAARAVDLSSMVNVNTATDQLVPPTPEYPMGLTPADVDLRRLLTMQDAATDYQNVRNGLGLPLSLAQLHRPYAADDEPQFGPWRPEDTSGWEDRNLRRSVYDYWLYKQDYPAPGSPRDTRYLSSSSNGMLIGRYAYSALRAGITLGDSLSGAYVGQNIEFGGPGATPTGRTDLLQYESDPTSPNTVPGQITPELRVEQYMNTGRLDPTNVGLSWSHAQAGGVVSAFGSGLYDIDDLAELLTFHGLNDPENTSRLERVTTGRYQSPMSGGVEDAMRTRRMGPLMSNRPLTLDRDQHGVALTDINSDPNTPPSYQHPDFREVNGRVSFNSMATVALTPRNKMTTISGFNPIWTGERLPAHGALPSGSIKATPLSDQSVTPLLSEVFTDAKAAFRIYSGALAGELDSENGAPLWQADPDPVQLRNNPSATVFYGHRGPELALRIAAHAAVNMKDLGDGDSKTTVATLMLDNSRRTALTQTNNFDDPTSDGLYQLYPGVADGNLLDPGVDQIGNSNGTLPNERQAVNVYGMEAMPVITEVSSLYLFTDSSDAGAAPGVGDFGPNPIVGPGSVTYPPDDQREQITIDDTLSRANKDYLLAMLAIQLHNPYDHPISLGGESSSGALAPDAPLTRQRRYNDQNTIDPNSNYQFGYYIEFAGRFYKLAKYIEWYPTSRNSENYYAHDSSDIAFQSVLNPVDAYPDGSVGGVMNPTDQANSFPDFITRNVVLQPGETRVFYVLADRRYDDPGGADGLDNRWKKELKNWNRLPNRFESLSADNDLDLDNLPDGPTDTRGWTGPAAEWVNGQLSPRNNLGTPVLMMEFDPRDGSLIDERPVNLIDPTINNPSPAVPGRTADNMEVRLWKKITTSQEEVDEADPAFTNPTYRNLIENDLLADRFELPEALSVPTGSGDIPIPDTISYAEDFNEVDPGTGERIRNDNTGITIARWKTSRRLDSDTEERPSLGQVTPWMLHSRSTPSLTRESSSSNTHPPADPAIRDDFTTITASDLFDGADVTDITQPVTIQADYEIQQSMRDMWELARNNQTIVKTLGLPPHSKSGITRPGGPQDPTSPGDAANRTAEKFPSKFLSVVAPATAASLEPGTNGEDLVPEIFVGGSHISRAPRLGDLLLAWGIGPTYAPDPVRPVNTPEYHKGEWMTAPEAMAIALGVTNTTTSNQEDADSIWRDAYSSARTDNLLDLGRLAIDRFVPYVNNNTSENPPEFTLGSDTLRGAGVPLALGVIDRARAIAPLSRLTDPVNPVNDEAVRLKLSRPTFGTINLNTAPLEVLRLLPGLTPSRARYVAGTTAGDVRPEWWGADPRFTDAKMPELTQTALGSGGALFTTQIENPDIAAGIVAYRDRMYMTPNVGARPEVMGITAYDNGPMNLSPTDPAMLVQNMIGERPLWDRTSPTMLPIGNYGIDRESMTGIEGLRQTPGFGSLGELLALRINPAFSPTTGTPGGTSPDSTRWNDLLPMSIQLLGYDRKAQGVVDNGGVPVTILSQIFANNDAGDTVDGYDEKIAMANAVFNTLSVRSDFFAVWFVVQGFRESDVANLRPEDPLVPSFKKRYMMVIDRSNVIEPGDEPKVLLLKEVPL